MEMTTHIFVAFGAVAAALIAGLFSYSNMISTKESKVSEFRQNWINELRKEITSYVASVQALVSLEEELSKHNKNLVDKLGGLKKRILKQKDNDDELEIIKLKANLNDAALSAYYSIQLRVNKYETETEIKAINQSFVDALDDVKSEIEQGMPFDTAASLNNVVQKAEILLKYEWIRVRSGEKAYRSAKKFSFGYLILVTIVFFGLLIAVTCSLLDHNQTSPKQLTLDVSITSSSLKNADHNKNEVIEEKKSVAKAPPEDNDNEQVSPRE